MIKPSYTEEDEETQEQIRQRIKYANRCTNSVKSVKWSNPTKHLPDVFRETSYPQQYLLPNADLAEFLKYNPAWLLSDKMTLFYNDCA